MKKSSLFVMAIAASLCVGGWTFQSQATESSFGQRPGRGPWLERAKERLGLTADQLSQIKSILSADKETLTSLVQKLHEARVGMREAIQSAQASEASVRSAAAKLAIVQADLAVERFKLHHQISPLLTEGQREKIKEHQARIDDLIDRVINRVGERLGSN